jgi:hypothetical protein
MRQTIRMLVVLVCSCGPGPERATWCNDYLACDAKTLKTAGVEATYGEMGTCWTTTQAAADACINACHSVLDSLKQQYLDAGC